MGRLQAVLVCALFFTVPSSESSLPALSGEACTLQVDHNVDGSDVHAASGIADASACSLLCVNRSSHFVFGTASANVGRCWCKARVTRGWALSGVISGTTCGEALTGAWVLGAVGASCTDTCISSGQNCSSIPQLSSSAMIARASTFTLNCATLAGKAEWEPGLWVTALGGDGKCYHNAAGTATCSGRHSQVQRFCFCGSSSGNTFELTEGNDPADGTSSSLVSFCHMLAVNVAMLVLPLVMSLPGVYEEAHGPR